jgi:hypothetical protein
MATKKPAARKATARKAVSKADGMRTIAHLASSAGQNLAHGARHVSTLNPNNKASASFNKTHAVPHLRAAAADMKALAGHIAKNPTLAKETKALKKANPNNRKGRG